jgi:hypothetical protein
MATLAPKLPYTHPFAGGFPYRGSQRLPSDPDALTYLAAVAAADGAPVETAVAVAVDDFFKGCKADPSGTPGDVTGMRSRLRAYSAGLARWPGALVPLVGTAPTNVADGFVEGDYTRGGATPGLKGDGTSYLNTGRAVTADPQNNCHVSAFRSDLNGSEFSVASLGVATTGAVVLNHANPISGRLRNTSFTSGTLDGSLGFAGFSRQDSGFFSARADAQSETITQVSAISGSVGNYGVFMFLNGLAFSTATIAFYSIGESLDLAALDARVTALVTAIGAAV